ncbi:hypothetical protein ABPG72_017719, partial [Tetrahymena utriculariae]
MNNSTPVDNKDNSSIKQFANNYSDKSKSSYDKVNNQAKIGGVGSIYSQERQLNTINSFIRHENIQFPSQQPIKSNHDKSLPSYDKSHSQNMVIEVINIESLNNLKQQQFQKYSSNPHIKNQGNSSQSQISYQNECFFPLSGFNEVEVGPINPDEKSQQIYNSFQLIQNHTYNEQFQQNKKQIEEQLRKKYELGCCIQTGGESLIFENKKNKNIIIKIIFNQTIDSINTQKEIFERIKNERNGKNFLQLIDHIKINDNIHIFIHKKCQKSLYQKLNFENNKTEFKEEHLIKILFNLIQGLIDLNNQSIIHLDIKPQNILVDSQGNYIYCDYGTSVIQKEGENFSLRGHSQPYSSLEQKNGDISKIGFASDIYSLGVTLMEVLKKFTTSNPNSLISKFVEFIQNIIRQKMIQDKIKNRSDCYSIHYDFTEELFKIKDKIADLKFFREITNEINYYLRQQYLLISKQTLKQQSNSLLNKIMPSMILNKRIHLQSIEKIEQKWPSDVTIFYTNKLKTEEFISTIKLKNNFQSSELVICL